MKKEKITLYTLYLIALLATPAIFIPIFQHQYTRSVGLDSYYEFYHIFVNAYMYGIATFLLLVYTSIRFIKKPGFLSYIYLFFTSNVLLGIPGVFFVSILTATYC